MPDLEIQQDLRRDLRRNRTLRKALSMTAKDPRVAPRAMRRHVVTSPVVCRTASDPALMAVAKMVVAGVDKKHDLHPNYGGLVKSYGEEKARELIEEAVTFAGACDIIQTEMDYGGIGLFGGLSKNGTRFIFYEWSGSEDGQLSVSMTKQEARNIVSGKKKTIIFKPERCRVRLCVDPFKRPSKEEAFEEEEARPWSVDLLSETSPDKRIYTKDCGAWALPRRDDGDEKASVPWYPDTFRVVIGRRAYDLVVGGVHHPSVPVHEGRIHIVLEVSPEMRCDIRKALSASHGWKLRSRDALLV